MTDELKPCPFCGGEPYTREVLDEDLSTRAIVPWKFVGCSNCDVSFSIPDGYDCGTASGQWNTRSDHAQALTPADALAAQRKRDAQTYRMALEAAAYAIDKASYRGAPKLTEDETQAAMDAIRALPNPFEETE